MTEKGKTLAKLSDGKRTITVVVGTRIDVSARFVDAMRGQPQSEFLSFESEAAAHQALGDLTGPDAFENARALLDAGPASTS
jgi:hypothetical protein